MGPSFRVGPFAVPQFMHVRAKVSLSDDGASYSVSDSTNEFGSVLGVTFATHRLFFGPSVTLTTIEDSDPVFDLRLGLLF